MAYVSDFFRQYGDSALDRLKTQPRGTSFGVVARVTAAMAPLNRPIAFESSLAFSFATRTFNVEITSACEPLVRALPDLQRDNDDGPGFVKQLVSIVIATTRSGLKRAAVEALPEADGVSGFRIVVLLDDTSFADDSDRLRGIMDTAGNRIGRAVDGWAWELQPSLRDLEDRLLNAIDDQDRPNGGGNFLFVNREDRNYAIEIVRKLQRSLAALTDGKHVDETVATLIDSYFLVQLAELIRLFESSEEGQIKVKTRRSRAFRIVSEARLALGMLKGGVQRNANLVTVLSAVLLGNWSQLETNVEYGTGELLDVLSDTQRGLGEIVSLLEQSDPLFLEGPPTSPE